MRKFPAGHTVTLHGTDAMGKKTESTAVYDKQLAISSVELKRSPL